MPEPSGNIHLAGFVDIPEARLDDILAAMKVHSELTRAEPGCICFVIERDEERPCRLNVEEIFENRAAFEFHQSRSAASDRAQITKGIERHYKIREL